MKAKFLVPTILALTMSVAAASSMSEADRNLLGKAAPAAAANRTIVITPATILVNVQGGQIVTFDVAGKKFTWNFDVPEAVASFDLALIAPPGVLGHPVKAFVSPNPRYLGA
jgi:hypothetical protein